MMRILNRIASAVLAVALIAGGLLLSAEAVAAALGRPPLLLPLREWYASLASTAYADRAVLAASAGIGLLGLLILIAQLRPWPADHVEVGGAGAVPGSGPAPAEAVPGSARPLPESAPLRSAVPGGTPMPATVPGVVPDTVAGPGTQARWRIARRSVEHRVAGEIAAVPGVTQPVATVHGRPSRWALTVRAAARPEQLDDVRRAARRALDRLAAPADIPVKIDLRSPRRVS